MNKKYLSIIGLFFGLTLASTYTAICGDLNAFYSMDYDGFWNHWNKLKKDAVACTDAKKTSMFFSSAIETIGNAEVSEANAEEIEKLTLNNPECMLQGLSLQTDENQTKFIIHFIINPIYNDKSVIEKSLNSVWDRQKYLDLKKIYYKIKKEQLTNKGLVTEYEVRVLGTNPWFKKPRVIGEKVDCFRKDFEIKFDESLTKKPFN